MIINFTSLPEDLDWLCFKGVLLIKESLPLPRRLEIIADHESDACNRNTTRISVGYELN